MAIDPTTTTTVRVGELGAAAFNSTDLVPHEVSGVLKKGTLQDLATFIGSIISVDVSVGFRAVQVNDGETLPATDQQEFILVGPGTYPNVGGGATITTTGALNALVSNGVFWFIGVEIPIEVSAIWGDINGVLSDQTDLNDILVAKADLVGGKVPNSQLPSYVDDVIEVNDYASLPSTGETGKIYVTKDTGNIYRWSGSAYIRIADESPVWGIITGTLSNQTDLQSALDAKFDDPTGDTTQYIAGDGSLITFPVAGQAGTIVREVKNTSGSTITKGTIVYINGASGNKATIAKAIATGDSTSAQTFGFVQADIANNANGYVVCLGDLIGLNTSGISVGTQLYLSSTTAGEYTTTKQVAPAHLVYVGVVTRSHATLGQIEVKIQNGYELDELHDVAISSKTNKDLLTYESSTDLWKNKSLGTILGGTSSQFVKGDGSLVSNVILTDNNTVGGTNYYIGQTMATNDNWKIYGNSIALDYGEMVFEIGDNAITDGQRFRFFYNETGGGGGTSKSPFILNYNEAIFDTKVNIGNGGANMIGKLFVKGLSAEPNNTITISTPDFVSSDTGSILTIGHNANSGSTQAIFRNIINGGSAYGDICFPYGKVGIGTISPNGKFNISNSGAEGLEFWTATTTATNMIQSYNRSTSAFNNIRYEGLDHIFSSSGTERMRITSGGNVGIGTSTFVYSPKLAINSVGSNTLAIQTTDSVQGSTGSVLYIGNGATTGNTYGVIRALTSGGTGTGNLVLQPDGAGNVGINTTSPGQTLDVNGNVRGTGLLVENTTGNQQVSFRKSGSMRYAIGTEVGAGSTNDWSIYNYVYGGTSFIIYGNNNYQFFGSNVSDIRAKEKIVDLDFYATEKVMALQPKSYYMKNDSKQIRYGLIAQEVNEVLPDLVYGDVEGDDFVGLDYNGVIPVLIKAIQELKAEIETLKNK